LNAKLKITDFIKDHVSFNHHLFFYGPKPQTIFLQHYDTSSIH